MKPLKDQNLKIKIQILDENETILIQSSVDYGEINDLNVYQGISGVDQLLNVLLEEVKRQQEGIEE